jgi:glycosyltransferase involved in cell wall biosynthesis
LARRLKAPLVYDHPPATEPPRKLDTADVVIAPGAIDAAILTSHLAPHKQPVIVPPARIASRAIAPGIAKRLGCTGRVLALQDAGELSQRQAEALVVAISPLPDIDLVLLGGSRLPYRDKLTDVATRMHAIDHIHLIDEVPSARRVDYLSEADVGLALSGGGYRAGLLPAADVFSMLGIPFVVEPRTFDQAPTNCVVSSDHPAALRGAITEARKRRREPMRDDGASVLQGVLASLIASSEAPPTAPTAANPPLLRRLARKAAATAADSGATALLAEASKARDTDQEHARSLYLEVAGGEYQPAATAAAATGLARLGARADALNAISRVLDSRERPPLATARAGEAAAVLGDIRLAGACAEEVVALTDAPDLTLRTALRVLEQIGEPTSALRVARKCGDQLSVARIEGTLQSYDPTWLPTTAGKGPSLATMPRRVFTLLETSLPHMRSGYTYRARTMLRAQREAGLEPIALTRLGFPANRRLTAPPVEDVEGIVHHRATLPGVTRYTSVPMPRQLAANVRWAASLAQELRPEALIATTPHLNGLVGLALRDALRIPMAYDVRGFPEMTWAVREGGADTEVFQLRREAETRCMREADLVTTLSETMRSHIVSRGIPPEKVVVLPHAVDTATFAPGEGDPDLLTRFNLKDRTVIGYISSLVAYEGVETLLDAIALARRANPEIVGLIVGDGDLLASLKARARELEIADHVIFTGRVDASDVARYYSLTDVFVCPRHDHEVTRYVTPLKPFEAMAAGCCVAVSDLPTLREAVKHGACGELFRAGDPEALASTILTLASQPHRRRELSAAARDRAVANHSFDALCGQVRLAWQQLTETPAQPLTHDLGEVAVS